MFKKTTLFCFALLLLLLLLLFSCCYAFCLFVCACMRACAHVCVCVCVRACVCVCVCMCVIQFSRVTIGRTELAEHRPVLWFTHVVAHRTFFEVLHEQCHVLVSLSRRTRSKRMRVAVRPSCDTLLCFVRPVPLIVTL